MKNEEIFNFLIQNGFEFVDENKSEFFNDYFIQFTNSVLIIRLLCSKNIESIDICSTSDIANWYDLALIKALLYDEKYLIKPFTSEDYKNFLLLEFMRIKELFTDVNYIDSSKKLRKLEVLRARQMFPNNMPDKHNAN